MYESENDNNMTANKKTKLPYQNPELSVDDLSRALYETSIRLAESNQKLQQSETLRSEMIANLSHDFRSPIASLQGYLEYLIDFHPIDPDETLTVLEQMKDKTELLNRMLNDFFSFSSLEYTDQKYLFETVDLIAYLSDFYQKQKSDPRFSQRELSFVIGDNTESCSVSMDSHWFSILLDNLYSNALKFTDINDQIQLSATLDHTDLIVELRDTGIGIKAEHIPYLFDRTYKVSSSRTPGANSGCGLGLSIAKRITELHHGQIWCESKYGLGSSFFIRIPTKNRI